MTFDEVERAIDAIARGEFVVVVDDEDRENEGDLIIAADRMTPEKMGVGLAFVWSVGYAGAFVSPIVGGALALPGSALQGAADLHARPEVRTDS